MGAAYWLCHQLVLARAARETYGISCLTAVQPFPEIHARRQHLAHKTAHGQRRIVGKFDPLIQRVSCTTRVLSHATASYHPSCLPM